MSNIECELCMNKKIIWKIFECNVEEKESCVCRTCVVLLTCTRLCNKLGSYNKRRNYNLTLRKN